MSARLHTGFGAVATVVVAAVVAWGFVLVGSPDARRQQRLDDRRLDDLQVIHRELQLLVRDPDRPGVLCRPLPASLEAAAAAALDRRLPLRDPVDDAAYVYRVTGEATYVLGATFALPRTADAGAFWNHPAGAAEFTIDALASAADGSQPR